MSFQHQSIVIRDIEEIDEFYSIENLQKTIWRVEDREILPALAMIPMREVGAIIIGAFANGEMVAFAFAFAGHEDGQLILHSDMLAVLPEFRSYGLGYQLKLAQRERAIEKGIETITWTFDPLQSRNAFLNFNKLGVISNRYLINYYGETTSFLHSNGTDRLWVRWELNSQRVISRVVEKTDDSQRESVPRIVVKVGEDWEPESGEMVEGRSVIIEIPTNISEVQNADLGLARRWRTATRDAFTRAIELGFVVEEFLVNERAGQRVGQYLLRDSSSVKG